MSKHEEKAPVHSPRRHGRTVPVLVTALTLVVGSATLWTSPASARDFPDQECLPLNPSAEWSGHWLLNTGGPNNAAYTVRSIMGETVDADLSTDLVFTFNFEDSRDSEDFTFYVEFFDDEVVDSSGCRDNYANPPAGVCVTFSTTGWSPSSSESTAYDYYFNNEDGFTFEDLGVAFDTPYEFDLTDVSGATAQGYYFQWSDSATDTSTKNVTFTARFGLCSSGGDDSSGRRPSVDLDHYRERAAAEASSLPNTL